MLKDILEQFEKEFICEYSETKNSFREFVIKSYKSALQDLKEALPEEEKSLEEAIYGTGTAVGWNNYRKKVLEIIEKYERV